MITFKNPMAEVYFPDSSIDASHLSQTTHLAVGAHQDDIEIFAIHGILEAFDHPEKHFTGITVTDGRGAPRSGSYAEMSDDDLWHIRCEEQRKAAQIGKYHAQFLLNYTSDAIKSPVSRDLIDDLKQILAAANPEIIYTHNLADKHDTHVAVALALIQAIRELNPLLTDVTLFGCEVWRGLDWLPDDLKVAFDVSRHTDLQEALLSIYESQIAGGKRYDLATMGRRLANATYHQSHLTDAAASIVYAMDLTPLITHPETSIDGFISRIIQTFETDVRSSLNRLRMDSG